MNLRSIDLNLLTIFDAISAEKNLSRAADKIGMTQPAVSAALGRLRVILNDDLFTRTGRGVQPTPKAIELERPVRQILEQINVTLLSTEVFDLETTQRVYNLASIDYASVMLTPRLISNLQTINSGLRVNVCSQYDLDLKEQLYFGKVDFSIENIPITDHDFHIAILRKERPFCLFRKDHPKIKKKISLKMFLECEHVVLFPRNERISLLDEHLLSKGLKRKYGLKVPSFFNMPYIVKETDMICGMPESMALHFAKLHGLKALLAPVDDWLATYYLMWHKNQHNDEGHRWMRETILDIGSR